VFQLLIYKMYVLVAIGKSLLNIVMFYALVVSPGLIFRAPSPIFMEQID